jgi:hypothetical protein
MPFRFRVSIKILSGVRLRLSRSGISTSIGIKGAHVTLGLGRVRETIVLPGTGLSYTHVSTPHQSATDAPGEAQSPAVPDVLPKGRAWRRWAWIAALMAIGAVIASRMTPP